MIFADKLIDLRKKSGWSQEELAEKLEVSRQTISKWEGALSTPDLGRMLKIAQLFGVTTDYLMKDELELTECVAEQAVEDGAQIRQVSMEQAVEFIRLRYSAGKWIALGVLMCILCAVPLILLGEMQELGRVTIHESTAAGIGCLALFLMVASAVGIFIHSGLKMQPYEFLEQEPIETAYGVDGMVRERRKGYSSRYTQLLITGILLCVLCPTPLFATMVWFGEDNDWMMAWAVVGLLTMVAVGVYCIVRTCIVWGSFQLLLEEGDYTREKKLESRRNSSIAGIYWGVVTALYLGYSFVSGNWERSWIIWPVAGVCYGVLECVLRMLRNKRKE